MAKQPIGDCSCGQPLWLGHELDPGLIRWYCDRCGRVWVKDPTGRLIEVE